MKSLANFLTELKRRRVYRVAAVYAGVAFIIIQIIDGAFDYLNIPEVVGTTIIVLLAIGFPIIITLAWAFDITDEGIVRAKGRPADAKRKTQPLLGNKSLAVIAVLAIAFGIWTLLREPSQPGGTVISSVAVLPLENQMGDPDQEYVVDGVHEALTKEVSTLSALRVIGRTSTLSYKGNPKPIPDIAEELDVDAVVEGSVFRSPVDQTIRITVQLVATKPERHIFQKEYEGDLADILSIHKTIVTDIAAAIGLTLTPEEEDYLASAPQVNPEAFNLYLQGEHYRILEGNEDLRKAVEYYKQAVALDSTFAVAYASMAYCYFQLSGGWSRILTTDTGTLGKQALDKALELDPNNVQALVTQALFKIFAYWDIPAYWDPAGAEVSFRRALELDPDNTYALYEYGLFLSRNGRPDEGIVQLQRLRKLDPLGPRPYRGLANWLYGYIRQYEKQLEARRLFNQFQGNDPSTGISAIELNIAMQEGRYAEAAVLAEEAGNLWVQLQAEWALGNEEKVYAIRDSMIITGVLPQQEQENPFNAARYYAIIGEKDKALGLLERAYDNDSITWTRPMRLVYDQEYDILRADPRFKDLLAKLGITEAFDENGQLLRPLPEGL